MSAQGRDSDGLWIAVVIIAVLIVALVAGAGALLYRQARLARTEAVAQRALAEQREREVRQLASDRMKELADLEEKEVAATPPQHDDPVRISSLHTDLAESYLARGERDKAILQFRDALDVLTKAFGEDDPRTREAADRLKNAENPAP